jgi:hypothetical protein
LWSIRHVAALFAGEGFLNVKIFVVIWLIAAIPVCAQAKPRASKGDAQKLVTIIEADKAKTQAYCEIQNLAKQVDHAYQKKDDKMADELSQKMDKLEDTLGPDYTALIGGLQDDQLGAEFVSAVASLDRLCTR